MHTHFPSKTSVQFQGINWQVEKLKLEKRFDQRRNKKRNKKCAKPIKMNNEDLKEFLVVAEGNEQILVMDWGQDLLQSRAFNRFYDGEAAFETLNTAVKMQHLLGRLDEAVNDNDVRHYLLAWAQKAKEENLFTPPSDRISDMSDDGSDSGSSSVGLNQLEDAAKLGETFYLAVLHAAAKFAKLGLECNLWKVHMPRIFNVNNSDYIHARIKVQEKSTSELLSLGDDEKHDVADDNDSHGSIAEKLHDVADDNDSHGSIAAKLQAAAVGAVVIQFNKWQFTKEQIVFYSRLVFKDQEKKAY